MELKAVLDKGIWQVTFSENYDYSSERKQGKQLETGQTASLSKANQISLASICLISTERYVKTNKLSFYLKSLC